jgi:hypothetical protein
MRPTRPKFAWSSNRIHNNTIINDNILYWTESQSIGLKKAFVILIAPKKHTRVNNTWKTMLNFSKTCSLSLSIIIF